MNQNAGSLRKNDIALNTLMKARKNTQMHIIRSDNWKIANCFK